MPGIGKIKRSYRTGLPLGGQCSYRTGLPYSGRLMTEKVNPDKKHKKVNADPTDKKDITDKKINPNITYNDIHPSISDDDLNDIANKQEVINQAKALLEQVKVLLGKISGGSGF